ncbi:hypothetical protein IC63_15825 [Paracoccus sphaerophysae]|uniref:Uncharacterized protein n=1 Tax=Paracoccus sphaerophysae TaxID=690417 RepID=A0A099EVE9_9RHOB|nr:hypothetical protein IC63_15825 [Paracoccus sphaerophysae]
MACRAGAERRPIALFRLFKPVRGFIVSAMTRTLPLLSTAATSPLPGGRAVVRLRGLLLLTLR